MKQVTFTLDLGKSHLSIALTLKRVGILELKAVTIQILFKYGI